MSLHPPPSDVVSEVETTRLIRCRQGRAMRGFGLFALRRQPDPPDGCLLSALGASLLAAGRGETVSDGGGI